MGCPLGFSFELGELASRWAPGHFPTGWTDEGSATPGTPSGSSSRTSGTSQGSDAASGAADPTCYETLGALPTPSRMRDLRSLRELRQRDEDMAALRARRSGQPRVLKQLSASTELLLHEAGAAGGRP